MIVTFSVRTCVCVCICVWVLVFIWQEHSVAEKNFGKVDHSQSSPLDDEFNPWSEEANAAVWALQDEGAEGFQYVNLDLNPEKFTG